MLTFRADPNVSEEAKQHAREVLKNEGVATGDDGDDSDDLHQTRVNAGYKAALHSTCLLPRRISLDRGVDSLRTTDPHVSEEAKEHAREVLKSQGEL